MRTLKKIYVSALLHLNIHNSVAMHHAFARQPVIIIFIALVEDRNKRARTDYSSDPGHRN